MIFSVSEAAEFGLSESEASTHDICLAFVILSLNKNTKSACIARTKNHIASGHTDDADADDAKKSMSYHNHPLGYI